MIFDESRLLKDLEMNFNWLVSAVLLEICFEYQFSGGRVEFGFEMDGSELNGSQFDDCY